MIYRIEEVTIYDTDGTTVLYNVSYTGNDATAPDDDNVWTFTVTNTISEGELIICKDVDKAVTEVTTFVFKVYGPSEYPEAKRITREVIVVIDPSKNATHGEVTLVGVPIGHYTVTEYTDWSWRYTEDVSALTAVKYSKTAPETTANALTDQTNHIVQVDGSMVTKVTFSDKLTNENWLSGTSYVNNLFGSTPAGNNNGVALPVEPAPVAILPPTEEEDKKKRDEA